MSNMKPFAQSSRPHATIAGGLEPPTMSRVVIALAASGLALAAAMPAAAVLPAGAPRERVASFERNDLDRRLPLQAGALQRFDASRVAVSSSRVRAKAGGTLVTVTDPGDPEDLIYGPILTPGTLRWAINQVNSQCFYGPYTINFNIPTPAPVIFVASTQPLNSLNCNDTLVDGLSQSGGVTLDGTNLGYGSGLDIGGDRVEVRGLSIINMPYNGIETFCGGSNSWFHSNNLANNNGYGISIGDGECGEVDSTVVEANTITGNASGGISVFGYNFTAFAAASPGKARFEKGSQGANGIFSNLVTGNSGPGLRIDGDPGTLIGDLSDPSMANEFTLNLGPGVEVFFGAGGQKFGINYTDGNSSGIGFDINVNPLQLPDGPTANDTGDSAPPQNHPVLSAATFDTSSELMRLQGGLDTFNTGPFTVLVFGGTPGASYEAGPYLGQFALASGGSFDLTLPYVPATSFNYGGITTSATSEALGAQSSEISALLSLPLVTQDKTSLAFGAVPVGGTATQSVTVSNATGFALLSATTTVPGVTVDASACAAPTGPSCVVSVTYAPQVATPISGTVEFESNSAGLQRLSVAGSGGISLLPVTWSASPGTVIAGSPSVLTLAIANPNAATFSSSAFTYTLPSGLVVPAAANVVNAPGPCAGTLVPATDGLSFTVSGLQVLSAGSCSFSVDVTSATPATYNVSMAPGTIVGSVLSQSNVSNATSNTASIVVNPVPVPLLVVSPAPPGPISFGSVTLGSASAFQTVTLTNAGSATLAFSGVPATAAPFAVNTATATPCPSSLPPAPGPGNSCTVEVRFQPTVVGAASGTVAFASNGGNATLDLVGNGTALPVPGISLTPASIAFPPQAVGTTSSPVQVMLSSAGTAPLAITSIGTTLGDFGLSTNCPIAPATLAAGSTCTITVTFAPLIQGDRIGTLTVASDAVQGTGTAALSGFGAPVPVPAVSVSSSTMSFPTTQVGTASEPLSLTVANAGGLPLAISAVEVVGSGFAVVSNSCVTTLAAGAQCSVTLVFAPSTTGTNAATLRILSNAPTNPTFVGLSGTATAVPVATLAAQPAALDFAIQEVATTSPPQTVTLTNTGGATATISGITVTGDFAQANNCSLVLPGGNCTISVTFTPAAAGTRAGSLVVAGDATNAPFAIALSGGGTPPPVPIIELSATGLSFGNSMVGRGSSAQAVTVRNTGGAPLVISGLNAPFEFPVSSGCPASIPAGESCRLDVGFLPAVSGPRQGRLNVLSNASNGTVGVGLSGTGCRISFLNRNISLICQ